MTFERRQWISVTDGQGDGVPEGRGGNDKGSVPYGAVFGPGEGGEGVGISGACLVGVNGAMEEICQVWRGKVV